MDVSESPFHAAPDERHPHGGDWLRDIVFGLNDGLVTTLIFIMVVSGVASGRIVLVALGEVLAGGISMALGGYLSADTALNIRDFRIETERQEIKQEPEEERAELRAIYHRKGFRDTMLEGIVDHLTSDEERWLHAMVTDEHGMVDPNPRHPALAGMMVGMSFVVGGLVPVLPFFFPVSHQQVWAYSLTAATALIFGSLKSRYTLKGPVRSGVEFLVLVTVGTAAGALLGLVLHSA